MRIVSLISSATEIVCSLGLGDFLVGRSHECDYPEWVRCLPVCTEPKFDVTGSSAEIDRLVRQTLQDSASVYRVFEDRLRELQPDLIVTQSQCDVCAVSLRDVEQAMCRLFPHQPRVVALQPDRLDDVWTDVRRIAAAAGVEERAARCLDEWRTRMAAVAERANSWGRRPRVACIEWIEPLMACGNWMPELVALAGGENVFGEPGRHSPPLRFEDLCRADPDVIVVMPCGFDLERTRQEMSALTAHPEWSRLRAVRHGRVWIADGNAYFNRPGPRLVESLEMLAEAINPAAFAFGHGGMETFA